MTKILQITPAPVQINAYACFWDEEDDSIERNAITLVALTVDEDGCNEVVSMYFGDFGYEVAEWRPDLLGFEQGADERDWSRVIVRRKKQLAEARAKKTLTLPKKW
jgi:hypothetical protein